MADERHPSPAEETRRLYEEAETRTARAFEHVVSRDSFGELLARLTENTVAVTKIWTDIFDLMLRNLRLAGRQDVTRLARQIGRTEDKIELLLQEVERLHDRADEQESSGRSGRTGGRRSTSANGRGGSAARPAQTTGSGQSPSGADS
jgi:hypothetical protein